MVLCVLCEGRAHGFAVAAVLGPDGALGRIWQVAKPVTYRCLDRLDILGLIRPAGTQAGKGPVRFLWQATSAGERAAQSWLTRPAGHVRNLRSEFLVKLALARRAGISTGALAQAQQAELAPIAAALGEHLESAQGFDRVLALWRYETTSASLRFLDAVAGQDG
jgi:PadR family transcriptional regulator AphA